MTDLNSLVIVCRVTQEIGENGLHLNRNCKIDTSRCEQ